MAWVIAGLGNPGEEYARTRHNAGRMALERFAKDAGFSEWRENKAASAWVSRGSVERSLAVLVLPETYMNKSGAAVAKFIKNVKQAEKLIVAYDDLDLPLGTLKISFDRGSGGHKGVESVMRALRTKKFWRLRMGISPTTVTGSLKKPQGEKDVQDFILGSFRESESALLKKTLKRASEALGRVLVEGPARAMNHVNSL